MPLCHCPGCQRAAAGRGAATTLAGTTAAVYIGTAAYFYFHCLPNTEINGKDFSYANRAEIEDYLKDKPAVTYEKLAYHRFGVGKYKTLGRKYPMDD